MNLLRCILISFIAIAASHLLPISPAISQTTFDLDHSAALTPVGVAGDLLTEGFPLAPTVAITAATIGLVAGDEIDALSFGDDFMIAGPHQLIFSVDPKTPASPVPGTGVAFEMTTDTAPGAAPAACGDLFLQRPTSATSCTNILAPGGFGYFTGTTNGDEANAVFASPNGIGSADDIDAFDSSPPATAATTGIYFSLAPGSPSLTTIPATPGDILYSPMGGGPVVIATLVGGAPTTDVNLGIPGRDLDALNCVAQSPGIIASGSVGPTPCSPGGGTYLIEFSIANFISPFVHLPSQVLGVNGVGNVTILHPPTAFGLCGNPIACGSFGDLDNLNALEVAAASSFGSTFDHNHSNPITPVGGAGDLLTEGFPGAPSLSLTRSMIGLLPGDEIDALSFGNDFSINAYHFLIFSVDPIEMGLPGSGVNFEYTIGTAPSLPGPGPNPPEACGDIFLQMVPPPTGPGNILAPFGFGYNSGIGTGDEFGAAWASPNVGGVADDLDAFDYSPAATALTTGIYFSLAPGSPSLPLIPATPGDVLYSPLGGGPIIQAFLSGGAPATDVNLGIAGEDLDALNIIASSPGTIAAGALGSTPAGGGSSSHLIEFSISYTTVPGVPYFPNDVLKIIGIGGSALHVPGALLGLCSTGICDNYGNLNMLEDPGDDISGVTPGVLQGGDTGRLMLNNTPNPFAHSTEIGYTLPESGPVRVEIFDISGRLLEKIFDGHQNQGQQRLSWAPDENANGVYLVRVLTRETIDTHRILLVR